MGVIFSRTRAAARCPTRRENKSPSLHALLLFVPRRAFGPAASAYGLRRRPELGRLVEIAVSETDRRGDGAQARDVFVFSSLRGLPKRKVARLRFSGRSVVD